MHGVGGLRRIDPLFMRTYEVDIPSLPVQRRIVSYLDSKTSEIDYAISLLEQKREAYTRLKASVINRAVTRGLNPDVKLKDSGVEWIGKIPEGWEVKRLKSIFTESKAVSSTGKEDLLSVSEYYGVAKRVDKMEDGEYISRAETLVGYKKCKKDDLVINIMLAWKRGLGFSDYDGIVSPSYAVYRGKNIVPHYFHYLLRTNMYIAEFKRNSKGIIDSRLRLYTDRFNNIKAVVPPLPEQRSIASYLDAECSKIDRAASIVEKQIDAYKRLKRSLINEVVTGKRKVD
jgi:type I restriction enzyme S subunit